MRKYIISFIVALSFTNCVTQKEYDKALNDYLNEAVKNKLLNQRIDSLNADYNTKNASLESTLSKLKSDSAELANLIESMKNDMDAQLAQYQKNSQEYSQKLKDAGDKNKQTNADLIQMQLDLEKQRIALQQKEDALNKANANLSSREAKIIELEKLLNEQKEKADILRNAIKNALVDFNAGELEVYAKDGKVYVSMSDKLLFKSGSTVVESKGVDALGKLATVIKSNADIFVNIEGHTDNVPYVSNGGLIKDNWDLSLLRASSVLHILTDKYKVKAIQLIASGRGEFFPKATNSTAEGRAANRRTEIILSPNVDKLLNIVNGQ